MIVDPLSVGLEIAFGSATGYSLQAVSENLKKGKFRRKVISGVAERVGFSEQQTKTLLYVANEPEFVRVFSENDFGLIAGIVQRHRLLLSDVSAEVLGAAFNASYRAVVAGEAGKADALLLGDVDTIKADLAEVKESVSGSSGGLGHGRLVLDGSRPDVVANFQVRSGLVDRLNGDGLTAVHGMGGVGKSQVASKFFRDNQHRFDVAVWVDMTVDDGLVDFELLAKRLFGRVDVSDLSVAQQVRQHVQSRSDERWLLVLDDAISDAQIEQLNPDAANCRTIVTSRNSQLNADTVSVGVFSSDMAEVYLERVANRPRDSGAAVLAEKLGFLPLGLRLAGTFCKQEGLSFSAYAEQHLDRGVVEALSPEVFDVGRKDDAIRQLWNKSLVAASARSQLAGPVLEVIAALDWNDVAKDWLCEHYPGVGAEEVNRACKALVGFSLCQFNPEQGSVEVLHNLIADGVINSADPEPLSERLAKLFTSVNTSVGAEKETVAHWEEPIRHLQQLAAKNSDLINEPLLPAVNTAVLQSSLHQQTPKVLLAETSLTKHQNHLGETHPDTLRARANLAISYWSVGRFNDAIKVQEQVLGEYVTVLGETHPDTLRARASLAISYWSVGRFNDAIELEEQVLAERADALSETHPDTLRARVSLAISYRSVGRFNDAIELQEQVLGEYVTVLGETHPDTLRARSSLAISYHSVGRYAEAIELQEQVLGEYVTVLGETHPDTIWTRANLAISYHSVGRYAEAIELQEQVLGEYVTVLGETHPDTIWTRANLAGSYRSVGHYDEALKLLDRVVTQSVEVLGPEHPDTINRSEGLTNWRNNRD